ncbi:MAG: BON domain-containing protein [Bryobacterales bacterium]|nr:BON domain-containing protein [Bryobacteraceae bacterium]MDW8354665.1 BON domain-containing protein [Bryobacterales bacterium]
MRWLSLVTVFMLLSAFAAAAWAQKPVSDDWIYDEVRRRLAGDRDVKGGGLDVEVRDGVVTLRGKVRTEKQKSKAERIARKVKGVKRVVNELVVEPF